ncbi:MAG: hypothetical protein DRN30_06510 [Thermoplasmata archaeon]|nr:MAG: hypothetical protein DRN30_06510 [Thermoplasmata archaeon]
MKRFTRDMYRDFIECIYSMNDVFDLYFYEECQINVYSNDWLNYSLNQKHGDGPNPFKFIPFEDLVLSQRDEINEKLLLFQNSLREDEEVNSNILLEWLNLTKCLEELDEHLYK